MLRSEHWEMFGLEDTKLLDFIVRVCDTIGVRPPGSEAERKTAEIIAERLRKYCDEVAVEEFATCPRVLQNLIDFVVYSYLVALVLYLFFPYLSAVLVAVGISIFYLTRFRGKEILDKFARKAKSQNVIGRIKPTGGVKKYVIFSGHHDSAYMMPLFQPKYLRHVPLIQNMGVVGAISLLILSVLKSLVILGVKFLDWRPFFGISIYDLLMVIPLIGLFFALFFKLKMVTNIPVMGANDNLSAVAVVLGLAEVVAQNRPKNVEVLLVSFGSEEPGLKGSRRFVEMHPDIAKNAYLVNLEMLGSGELFIDVEEKSIGVKHSKELAEIVKRAGEEVELKVNTIALPYGDTDAASFSRKGLHAVTIIALSPRFELAKWHLPDDVPENIREENLQKALKLCKATLEAIDKILEK